MSPILTILNNNAFAIQYFLACLIFLLPLERRSRFPVRMAVVFLLQFASSWVTMRKFSSSSLVVHDLWLDIAASVQIFMVFFCPFMIGAASFLFCAKLPLNDAVFGAACAYAVQHMSYTIYSMLTTILFPQAEGSGLMEILIFFCVAPLCYILFARKMPIAGQYQVSRGEAIRSAVIVLFFALYLSMLAGNAQKANDPENLVLFLICRTYAFLCCFFVLWAQTSMKETVAARAQLHTQELLTQKQREQYELSRDNIDIINRKCHDLKHQVAALREVRNEEQRDSYLEEIERSVMIYDSVVKTGNEVLDTILTERSLSCEKEGISWTCMADGAKLGFMDPVDLYTILGNALDNAIECVRELTDTDKRVVSVNVFAKPGMVVLQVENYYGTEIQFCNGLPVTSKEDTKFHGFGLHSIRSTAEKYGGSISIDTQNNIFLLCVVIPIP